MSGVYCCIGCKLTVALIVIVLPPGGFITSPDDQIMCVRAVHGAVGDRMT